jgi:hypothetical protein
VVPGMETNPRMQALCSKHADTFREVMNAVLQHNLVATGKGKPPAEDAEDGQDALSTIAELVEQCKKAKVSVLPSKTSAYKDMFPLMARLLLGEILFQVFRQVDHKYIGCSIQMTKVVSEFIDARLKHVAGSKAAHSKSRGKGNNLRPNVQEFMRCALPKMCRKAEGWKCQAAVTNFLSTVLFSIVKGEDCDYVDTLRLSDCGLFKVQTKGKPKSDGKGTTDEAGAIQATEGGSELREGEDDADSVSGSEQAAAQNATAQKANGEGLSAKQAKKKEEKKTNPWTWPGVRRLFKEWTEDQLVNFVTECLTIILEGGFWLLPHAHSEFAQNQMRGSNEQRESVFMFEVFKFVATKLAEERKDDPADGWNYQNFYTNKNNVAQVKAVFSNPTDAKCLWIKINPNLCGLGLRYSATNISIHLSKLRVDVDTADHALFEEEIAKVQKVLMDVIQFVCSLEGQEAFASGDKCGYASSRGAAEVKRARPQQSNQQEKGRSGSSTGSSFEAGISDARVVPTSTLEDKQASSAQPALLTPDDYPPDLEVIDDAEEAEEEDCERRDRHRHGHSELIKLGAAGAGKSGKIGVCVTTHVANLYSPFYLDP